MVKNKYWGPGRTFSFRRLRASDLPVIARWISSLHFPQRHDTERVRAVLSLHYKDGWKSRWDKSWVMTINGHPAFCISLHTEPSFGEGAPRPETGCGNQLFLLAAPRISRWPYRLVRAWYAATVYVFLHVRLNQVQILLPASAEEEGEGLTAMGYRVIETTTTAEETQYLYLCKREEFMPIL